MVATLTRWADSMSRNNTQNIVSAGMALLRAAKENNENDALIFLTITESHLFYFDEGEYKGYNAKHFAVLHKNYNLLSALLKKYPPSQAEKNAEFQIKSPLDIALENNDLKIIKLLIEHEEKNNLEKIVRKIIVKKNISFIIILFEEIKTDRSLLTNNLKCVLQKLLTEAVKENDINNFSLLINAGINITNKEEELTLRFIVTEKKWALALRWLQKKPHLDARQYEAFFSVLDWIFSTKKFNDLSALINEYPREFGLFLNQSSLNLVLYQWVSDNISDDILDKILSQCVLEKNLTVFLGLCYSLLASENINHFMIVMQKKPYGFYAVCTSIVMSTLQDIRREKWELSIDNTIYTVSPLEGRELMVAAFKRLPLKKIFAQSDAFEKKLFSEPLIWELAIQTEDTFFFSFLIELAVKPPVLVANNIPLMAFAAHHGAWDILLKIDFDTHELEEALMSAHLNGQTFYRADSINYFQNQILEKAARHNQFEIVFTLLKKGFDSFDEIALVLSACHFQRKEVVSSLLSSGKNDDLFKGALQRLLEKNSAKEEINCFMNGVLHLYSLDTLFFLEKEYRANIIFQRVIETFKKYNLNDLKKQAFAIADDIKTIGKHFLSVLKIVDKIESNKNITKTFLVGLQEKITLKSFPAEIIKKDFNTQFSTLLQKISVLKNDELPLSVIDQFIIPFILHAFPKCIDLNEIKLDYPMPNAFQQAALKKINDHLLNTQKLGFHETRSAAFEALLFAITYTDNCNSVERLNAVIAHWKITENTLSGKANEQVILEAENSLTLWQTLTTTTDSVFINGLSKSVCSAAITTNRSSGMFPPVRPSAPRAGETSLLRSQFSS